MATLPVLGSSLDLRAVTVRPTWGAREHRRWDERVGEHHYLRFHGVVGKGLRHVAVHGETWLALIGWQPGAFKLAARDRWIGWSAEQQFRRLHLIANNSRFVLLTPERVPNLASRVLGLSLRRLSGDIWTNTDDPTPLQVQPVLYKSSQQMWGTGRPSRQAVRQTGATSRRRPACIS